MKISTIMVLLLSVITFAEIDYSTINFVPDYEYQQGTRYTFELPVVENVNTVMGDVDMRAYYFSDEDEIYTLYSADSGETWIEYTGFPVVSDGFPDYYIADSMSYIYGTQDARFQADVDRSLSGGGLYGSLEFINTMPGGTAVKTISHLVLDDDTDGVMNYQDVDYNSFIVTPEPASLFLFAGGCLVTRFFRR